MKNSFDPIIDWLLYKPGRIVKVVAAVVALWLVSMVAGPVLMARPPAAPAGADAAPTPTAAADETSCREAAEEWAAELASRTAPEAVQALAGVDRSRVPTGGVRTVEVAADGVSCDARVRTGDGAVTALTLATADGAWLVTSWGSPSQESG